MREVKEARLNNGEKKMKETKLLCPNCGNDTFNRTAKAGVKVFDSGDCIRDEINWEECSYSCDNCDKDVTEEELVKSFKVDLDKLKKKLIA